MINTDGFSAMVSFFFIFAVRVWDNLGEGGCRGLRGRLEGGRRRRGR